MWCVIRTKRTLSLITESSSVLYSQFSAKRDKPRRRQLRFRVPISRADEEPVDQKRYLEEQRCKPKCAKQLFLYQACVKRIQGDESGHKHCTGQYFDYWFCVDKCVASILFSKLK
ncbi:hypothetical protein REPUB_Repub04eG0029100 [Reevesia pubescens]